MSEYKDPLSSKLEVKPEGNNFTVTTATSHQPEVAHVSDIISMLKVDRPNGKEHTMLEAIDRYLKEHAKPDSQLDRLVTLRGLENRLGVPKIGETRLSKLYQYVKLSGQIKEHEAARDSLLS